MASPTTWSPTRNFDTDLAWARKLAGQALLAVEQIKAVLVATWTRGSRPRSKGSQRHSCRRTARRGISAFLQKASWSGKQGRPPATESAEASRSPQNHLGAFLA